MPSTIIKVLKNGRWLNTQMSELKIGQRVQFFDAKGNILPVDGKTILTVGGAPYLDEMANEWRVVLY